MVIFTLTSASLFHDSFFLKISLSFFLNSKDVLHLFFYFFIFIFIFYLFFFWKLMFWTVFEFTRKIQFHNLLIYCKWTLLTIFSKKISKFLENLYFLEYLLPALFIFLKTANRVLEVSKIDLTRNKFVAISCYTLEVISIVFSTY